MPSCPIPCRDHYKRICVPTNRIRCLLYYCRFDYIYLSKHGMTNMWLAMLQLERAYLPRYDDHIVVQQEVPVATNEAGWRLQPVYLEYASCFGRRMV